MKLPRTPLPTKTGGPHGKPGKEKLDDTQEQLDDLVDYPCPACEGVGSMTSFDEDEQRQGIEDTCYRCCGTGRVSEPEIGTCPECDRPDTWKGMCPVCNADELSSMENPIEQAILNNHQLRIENRALTTYLGELLVDLEEHNTWYDVAKGAYYTCGELLDERRDDPSYEGTDPQGELINLQGFFKSLLRPEDL
jgi:RecJ-like exonuclease